MNISNFFFYFPSFILKLFYKILSFTLSKDDLNIATNISIILSDIIKLI